MSDFLLLGAKYLGIALLVLVIVSALFYLFEKPSNQHEWEEGQEKVATVSIDFSDAENSEGLVTIHNLRDFDWENKSKKYRNLAFKLTDIQSLHVGVSHFSAISELAHVFLLFELKNGESFGLSVEARREKQERFSLIGGLFARYELMYLLASKGDLIGLRQTRNEEMYLYPIKTSVEKVQKLFTLVAKKVNTVKQKPAFYHLFFRNCTTEIVKLVNQVSDRNYPFLVQAFAPGNTAKVLYKMDLIDIQANDFAEVQAQALIAVRR